MDWIQRYRFCLNIASQFSSTERYDIVHHTWLYFLERTGEDLFTKPLTNPTQYLYTITKRGYFQWYAIFRKSGRYKYFQPDELLSDSFENAIFGKDLLNIFWKRLKESSVGETTLRVFDLQSQGYNQSDIAENLQITKQAVNQHYKKVQNILNPFNGNRTKVTKRINRGTYDKNPKYKEEYEIGEWSDSNEYYTLLNSKTKPEEGLLIREGKDD